MKKNFSIFGQIMIRMAVAVLLVCLAAVPPATPPAAAAPAPAGETSPVKLIPKVVMDPAGRMTVNYEVRNTGKEPVYHLVLTAFLGQDVRRSEPWGPLAAGQAWTSYSCDFELGAMIPGDYILASRVSFDDQAGKPHLAYEFNPFMNRQGLPAGEKPPLTVAVKPAPLNAKSIGEATAKYKISLTNNHKGPVQAVVSFYLPDGIAMDETERFYEVGPGGTKEDEATVRLDAGVPPHVYPYRAVVWYAFNGVQYSSLLREAAPVEERPVLLIAFVLLSLAVFAAAGGWLWWRRRRRA